MKYLLLSLLLLSVPAQADKLYSSQECLQIFNAIEIESNNSKVPPADMISYYRQTCIPAKEVGTKSMLMVNAVISDRLVVAIKAKLAEQDLIKL